MADMLAEQARIYLRNQGAPISKYNIDQAKRELTDDPTLRPDHDGNSQMLSNVGYSDRPDGSRLPTTSMINPQAFNTYKPTTPIGTSPADPGNQQLSNKEMSPLRPDSGSAKEHDRYFTADSQFGSDPTADKGKAKATIAKARQMADNDLRGGRSKANQGGTAGATPGSPYGSVSTESVASTEASIPPVKTTPLGGDVDYSNQLAKPRPTSMGAGPGPREQAAAREPPMLPVPNLPTGHRPTTGPPVSPGAAPDPAPVAANQPPGGLNPVGAADLSSGIGAYNPNVGQTAQGLPPTPAGQPGLGLIDSIIGMLPEGTAQRAGNVAAIGAPLLAAFAALKGGRAPLTTAAGNMRPIGAPTGLTPPSAAALPQVMKNVSAAEPAYPALPPPAVSLATHGDELLSKYGPVGQPTPPQTGVVPAGPAQSVPPPVITPAAPPPQLALPSPSVDPIAQALSAAAPKAAGAGRAGTARLPPTPGKGMTLEDARASQGGGKPQPKKAGRARAKGNQK